MKKICIYTCITGNYDKVNEIEKIEDNIDYYLFTNNKQITSDTWKVVYIKSEELDDIRLARKIKILGHEILNKYEFCVWIDGSIRIKNSVIEFINKYCDFNKYDFIGFKHSLRNCIYDEALECMKLKKDNFSILKKQIEHYKNKNYPKNNGLIESGVFVKNNHSKKCIKTMQKWFAEIKNYSYRDQISFNYIANECGLSFKLLNLNIYDNYYFECKKHILDKNIKKYTVFFDYDFLPTKDSSLFEEYDVKNDLYIAKFKVLKNCSEIKFEFANFSGIKFANLKIDAKNINKSNLVNYSQYYGELIFDNGIPTIFLYGKFIKNSVITISINMKILSDEDYLKLIKKLNENVIVLSNKRKKTLLSKIFRLKV